jgi:hypothetical protein
MSDLKEKIKAKLINEAVIIDLNLSTIGEINQPSKDGEIFLIPNFKSKFQAEKIYGSYITKFITQLAGRPITVDTEISSIDIRFWVKTEKDAQFIVDNIKKISDYQQITFRSDSTVIFGSERIELKKLYVKTLDPNGIVRIGNGLNVTFKK